jgi:rhodanese-related sulfurtransferase
MKAGAVVLDTREPQQFAVGHVLGSINVGMEGRYAEYAGAVVAPHTNIVVATDEGHESEARIRLARIGYDNVVGWFSVDDLALSPNMVGKSSRLTAAEFAQSQVGVKGLQVVDVRNSGEFTLGSVSGARNIPVVQLPNRMSELDSSLPIVVFCAGGYRSSIASSLLKQAGCTDVSDVLGGFESIRLTSR